LGVITFATAESERRYDQVDLALAEELAVRAALALDNARLYREAQAEIAERRRAERRLAARNAATRALAEATTLAEAAPAILGAICESLGWEWGGFWTVDRERDVLACIETWHLPDRTAPTFD